jgi:hypothetical protein
MIGIDRRIGRLEARLTPHADVAAYMRDYRIASILHERRRLRMQQEGVPLEKLPPPLPPPTVPAGYAPDLQLSIAETWRARREYRSVQQAELANDIA